jgi:O-antigen ligase
MPSGIFTRIRARASLDNVLFFGLVLALGWVPFWFGSNVPLAWGINAVVFCGLAIVYELRLLVCGRVHPVAVIRIWPGAAAFLVIVTWCVIQVATVVPANVQHPIWQLTRETLELNVSGSISVNRDLTLTALMRLVTAASAFWLSLQLCRNPLRARLFVQCIAAIGLIYAVYGLVAFFVFPKTILWFAKDYYASSLTATFVNRNSYATYAAIGLACATTLILDATRGAFANTVARHISGFFASLTGNAGAWLAVCFFLAIAMTLTASRGGIAAGVLGLFAGIGFAILREAGPGRVSAFLAGLLAAASVVVLTLSFGDPLAARLDQQGFESDGRLATYALTWASVMDRPWLGFGYGTFASVFPMYRDGSVDPLGVWDKAHNTYLELLQGVGLPAGFLMMAGVGWLVWRCGVGVLTRHRSVTAPLAAAASSVIVLTHALVDFSLQIQAVALTWIALVGAGVAQSWSHTVETGA